MENKYKYLVAGFAIILFVLPTVISSPLIGKEDRECYNNEVLPGRFIFSCIIPGTDYIEKNFFDYGSMNEFYTPQLKEYVWGVGNMQVSGKRDIVVNVGYNDGTMGYMIESDLGTMSITGAPSYIYTKTPMR